MEGCMPTGKLCYRFYCNRVGGAMSLKKVGQKTITEENQGRESLGRLFVRELVKATYWRIVLLLAGVILLVGAK
jgi:hypothetical protein